MIMIITFILIIILIMTGFDQTPEQSNTLNEKPTIAEETHPVLIDAGQRQIILDTLYIIIFISEHQLLGYTRWTNRSPF